MQTFKIFFRLIAKSKVSILIYTGIFIGIAVMLGKNNESSNPEGFKNSEIPIAIVDRDNSTLSKAIKDYLLEGNKEVKVEDDLSKIRYSIFQREIYYALIIPEGFEENFAKASDKELQSIKVSDSIQGYKVDIMLESFMKSVKIYLSTNEVEDAVKMAKDTAKVETKVKLAGELDSRVAQSDDSFGGDFYYFYVLPYALVAIITSAICPVILAFRDDDIKRRINVSKQKFVVHNMAVTLGVVAFAIAINIIFTLTSLPIYGETITAKKLLLYGINVMVFSLVAVAIAFLGGNLFKKSGTVAAYSTTVSLGISFLGGVFVPVSVLGPAMQNVAKAMPTYYYCEAVESIATDNLNNGFSIISQGLGMKWLIMAGFAVVIFAVGLVLARKKA